MRSEKGSLKPPQVELDPQPRELYHEGSRGLVGIDKHRVQTEADTESKQEIPVEDPDNPDENAQTLNDVHEACMGNTSGITAGRGIIHSDGESSKSLKMELDDKALRDKRRRRNSSATDTEIILGIA